MMSAGRAKAEVNDIIPRAALIALKGRRERPPGLPHGRWLGDFLIEHSETGLTPGEEKLLASVVRGESCKLADRRPDTDNDRVDVSRRVRGSFLRFLALAGDTTVPVHEKGIELAGAMVVGAFDVQGARCVRPLTLTSCRFETAPVLRHAETGTLNFQGSFVPGFSADGVQISGDVFFSKDFSAEGEVCLRRAEIRGQLDCSDGTFRNRTKDGSGGALTFDGAKIIGDVRLCGEKFSAEGSVRFLGAEIGGQLDCTAGTFRNRTQDGSGEALTFDGAKIIGDVLLCGEKFSAEGSVRFPGAEISGQLDCSDGKFHNLTTDGRGAALDFERAEIADSVFLSGQFLSEGAVRLIGAEIGGDLACSGGTFNNKAAPEVKNVAAYALTLQGAIIDGTLFLGPATNDGDVTLNGSLDLKSAKVSNFVDAPDSWPADSVTDSDGRKLTCTIALDGFTYGRLVGGAQTDAATRRLWLARQSARHRMDEFCPQPYEQLVKVLREMGHNADARKIARSRQHDERWARMVRHGFKRPLIAAGAALSIMIFGGLTGYGYGVKRLIAMLVALWLVGTHVYQRAAEQGLMAPSNPIVFTNPALVTACAKNWTTCTILPKEHTAFSPTMYSADVLLPIVSLGVDRDWAPIFARPCEQPDLPLGSEVTAFGVTWPPFGLRLLYWMQIIGGWVLSGLLIAILSGVMKKDE